MSSIRPIMRSSSRSVANWASTRNRYSSCESADSGRRRSKSSPIRLTFLTIISRSTGMTETVDERPGGLCLPPQIGLVFAVPAECVNTVPAKLGLVPMDEHRGLKDFFEKQGVGLGDDRDVYLRS